jgi:dihydrofolate reductase
MNAIVCINNLNGIGLNNRIPWKSKVDLKFFKDITMGKGNNAVVMGRKTFSSLNNKPLPNRINCVITRKPETLSNLDNIIPIKYIETLLPLKSNFDDVFIIGGTQIYKLFSQYIDVFYVTHIHNNNTCDTYLNFDFSNYYKEIIDETIDENFTKLTFIKYTKKNI